MNKDRKDTAIYSAYDDYEARDPAAPEKNLLLAILMTAVRDLDKSGSTAQQARDYFLEQDDTYVFSFMSVCTLLGVSAHRVLSHLGLQEGDDEDMQQAAEAFRQSQASMKRPVPRMRKRAVSNGRGSGGTSQAPLHHVK